MNCLQRTPSLIFLFYFAVELLSRVDSKHTSCAEKPEKSDTSLCDSQSPYRTIDGSCNNLNFPTWGQAVTPFVRLLPPDYADGISAPRAAKNGNPLPSARIVSLTLSQDIPIESPNLTTLFIFWGQFITHDIDNKLERNYTLNLECCLPKGHVNPDPACLPIMVDDDDPFYAQYGTQCLRFIHSAHITNPHKGYRDHINNNTAFIDASTIYGSDQETAASLRLFREGLLLHTLLPDKKPLLPTRNADFRDCPSITGMCFRTGDFRVNMLPPLTAIHIMVMREHLRLAKELARLNPHWDDERIYQETRKLVGAEVQHITYKEYLPLIFNSDYLKDFDLNLMTSGYYTRYDPTTNPSISNNFAAAAFRFAHSLTQGRFHRYQSHHQKIPGLSPLLRYELSEPLAIFSGQIDLIALGMVNQNSREMSEHFTVEITNHLFENRTLGSGSGTDLLAIDIHRGRENGIPGYNKWREYCGLKKIETFEELNGIMPSKVVEGFASIYDHVDDIDFFAAGTAEYHLEGGLVGPTFACIIAEQFKNLRTGDRFWYENGDHSGAFTEAQLTEIRKSSLARLMCDNLEAVLSIQFRPMEVPKGDRVDCTDPSLPSIELEAWKELIPEQ